MKSLQLFSFLFYLLLAIPCQARIITVNWDGSGDYLTIQAAINNANNGDTIIVADGVYIGPGNRDIDFNGKAVTVRSENGPENCIIDCNATETDRHRGFFFWSGEDADSAIIGFTITNGYAPLIWVPYCCPFGFQPAWPGGGIFCGDSSPTITNCTITGNQAIGDNPWWDGGGGIACYGIYEYISPTITNCTFSGNSTSGDGGGIACMGGSFDMSSPTLANCTFVANSARAGGGMSNWGSNLILTNCAFSGNVAQDTGGAMANVKGINLTLTNCTFSGNVAPNGNALSCDLYYGKSYPSDIHISNCILWDGGSEIWNNDNSVITITYSDVQAGWPGLGNIDADPCFADPCNGDYHLKSQAGRWDTSSESWVLDDVTSPCIDAGNPGCPLGNEPNGVNNVRINMGAYGGTVEASKSPANWRNIADLTNDWVVDFNDLKIFVDYWLDSGQCIPSDLDHSQFVDLNDFAIFGWHWSYPSASEPRMTYQIEKCDPNSYRPFATEEAIETRFTVTVEGRYIHFKDMMVANCCSDKLELQMVVEDDLITIYEIEYLGAPCFCICDHPVTATLGPFQPGIYTLEVYEDWGGFIGSTTVVIGRPE